MASDTPTQADRDAAASVSLEGYMGAAEYRSGRRDNYSLVQAFAAHRIASTRQATADLAEALEVLGGLSSYLGMGLGDERTTAQEYDRRIREGIDLIGQVYRQRAADVVEECSKRPSTTWGAVRTAILSDTCLPTATTKHQEARDA